MTISQAKLKTLLRYEQDTGSFFWLVSRPAGVKPGDVAGHISKKDGYHVIKVMGRSYQAHRLAWFYVYGVWPCEIDHKDRKRASNAIENLRLATKSQNGMNTKFRALNTSGYRGVCWNKSAGKWQAQAKISGVSHHLGVFDSAEDASKAYEHFCRLNHGEFFASAEMVAA